MNDNRADEVYKVATDEKIWYYYAACGINISGKVIQSIEERDYDNFFMITIKKLIYIILHSVCIMKIFCWI